MKRKHVWWIVIIVILLFVVSEPFTHLFHRVLDNVLYDNYHHYLPCSKLPDVETVYQIFEQYQNTADSIRNVDPSNIEILIDEMTCPGKASILIYYSSMAAGKEIRQILPGKTFYGVPLSLVNW